MSAPTALDFDRLCAKAAERGLAVELIVSDARLGQDDSARRQLSRLRLTPAAARPAGEIEGTPIVAGDVYAAARVLLDRLVIRGVR